MNKPKSYIKKSTIIRASQLEADTDQLTLGGGGLARKGDYMVHGYEGENGKFHKDEYIVRKGVFEATYVEQN